MPNILKKIDDSWCSKWNHQDLNHVPSAHQIAPLTLLYTNIYNKWDFKVRKFTFWFKEGKKYQKDLYVIVKPMLSCILCFSSLIMNIKIITIVIIIISRLHWLDHFIYTVKAWVSCSWTKTISKNCYAHFCNREDKKRDSCKSPTEDVEANVEVTKDKIFSQPKCTH